MSHFNQQTWVSECVQLGGDFNKGNRNNRRQGEEYEGLLESLHCRLDLVAEVGDKAANSGDHSCRFVDRCDVIVLDETGSAIQTRFLVLFLAQQPPNGKGPPHSRGFLYHTQRRTTVGRTPLDE